MSTLLMRHEKLCKIELMRNQNRTDEESEVV